MSEMPTEAWVETDAPVAHEWTQFVSKEHHEAVVRGLSAKIRAQTEELEQLRAEVERWKGQHVGYHTPPDPCGARCRCIKGVPCDRPKGHSGAHNGHGHQ